MQKDELRQKIFRIIHDKNCNKTADCSTCNIGQRGCCTIINNSLEKANKILQFLEIDDNAEPLTVEELKALKVGDWVWITTPTNSGEYYQIGYSDYLEDENAFVAYSLHYELDVLYSDYNDKWLAYKNKEQEELKGD